MRLGSSLRRRRKGQRDGPSLKRLIPRWFQEGWGDGNGWWTFFREPRNLGLLAILAVLGFAGGYVVSTRVVYPLPPPPGDLFTVPDLSGLSSEDGADTLAAMGLLMGAVDSLNHPSAPQGTIVGQSPLPGQLSLPGDTVRVALSMGPERRPVPDVLRLRGDRARTVLETAGFVVTTDSVDSEEPRGAVVAMAPEAGTEATIPMEVQLSVSLGPPEFEMPLLLGRPEEEARAVLDSLGLNLAGVETRFRFGRDQGLVVEQEPPAGTNVQAGSDVRLVVGRRGGQTNTGSRNKSPRGP